MTDRIIGWAFPLRVDELTGRIAGNKLNDDIRQSLFVLLSTAKGERILNPDYGCNLQQFAFENVNYTLLTQIEKEVTEAIQKNEPRVKDVTVRLSESENENEDMDEKLMIEINYTIVENAESDSFLYPLTIRN